MRFLISGFIFFVLVLLSLSTGPMTISSLFSVETDRLESVVFWSLRLPRTMCALWVGASLGLTGALLQTLLRNPLAEPYTLGLSGSASFGAVAMILLGIEPFHISMPIGAVVSCLLTTLIVLGFSARTHLDRSKSLILIGVMVSLFFSSIVIMMMTLLKPTELQTAIYWMMGQIGTERDQGWVFAATACTIGLGWSLFRKQDLDRILLGESVALSLGTKVNRFRLQVIVAVSIIVSICVSISGLIGFIGLLAPHISKLMNKTHRHGTFLISSAIIGAILLLSSDLLGRMISGEREIPAGGLVAVMGTPVLIFLIYKRSAFDPS